MPTEPFLAAVITPFIESSLEPMTRMLAAVVIGGLIGLDRAYRGRSAGFRTHILVCLASALLMQLMEYQWQALPTPQLDTVRVDPTRMAQGIMTGIGFLGAGVIMQHQQIVRGLTTAASIWITAAIGIVVGAGDYVAAFVCTVLVLITLGAFSSVVDHMPTRHYAWLTVSFKRHESLTQDDLEAMLETHRTRLSNFAYKLEDGGNVIAYQMTLRTTNPKRFSAVAGSLMALEQVREFHLRPMAE